MLSTLISKLPLRVYWAVSADRGEFADRYRLLTSTLEQSAVSLSDEMVNLITAQRGYQISDRSCTTSDEIDIRSG